MDRRKLKLPKNWFQFQKQKVPALRDVLKRTLLEEASKIDKVLVGFKIHSITKTNELFYAGALVVTNWSAARRNKEAGRKEPRQRKKLENPIKELRKDLSQLKVMKSKISRNGRQQKRLERKYNIRIKTLKVVIEKLEQRETGIKVQEIPGENVKQNVLWKTECFKIIRGNFIEN